MSVTDARSAIAAQLSTVAGVSGYEFRPSTIKAGAAWPLLDRLDRGPGDAFAGEWRIVLALGGDEKTAQTKLDELLPLVTAALDPVAFVQSATPVVVTTSAGDMFAAEIRARSE